MKHENYCNLKILIRRFTGNVRPGDDQTDGERREQQEDEREHGRWLRELPSRCQPGPQSDADAANASLPPPRQQKRQR